ncbi:dioxygenase family protein [Dyella sp. Tek66A03]|uniref:dioxygenase family protein n=1 Tax=Dyella sp. Tek66A03 TaxID=3458298 RepID=UPI00403EE824
MTVLNRRRFVQFCLGGIAVLPWSRMVRALPDGRPACRLSAEQTEGPYYLDRAQFRQDITEGKPGLPLTLRFEIVDSRTCRPLSGTALEVWHCDAQGEYSGFAGQGAPGGPGMGPPPSGRPPGPPPGVGGPMGMGSHPPKSVATDELTFLRGVQVADARGEVTFQTIYPGYYMGRCNHIHMKLHVGGQLTDGRYRSGHVVHTGQLFFEEHASIAAMENAPYQRRGTTRTTLREDSVYTTQHGEQSIATLTPAATGEPQVARLTLTIDPENTSHEGWG